MAPVLTQTLAAACLVALLVAGCSGGGDAGTPQGRPTLTDPASVPTAFPDEERPPYRLDGERPLPPGSRETPAATPARPASRTHEVEEGETCGGIASAYGVSVTALLAVNPQINEECTNMRVGETLNIPAPDPGQAPATGGGGGTYTVVPGDTCAAIAEDHDVPLPTLLIANGFDEESCLTLQVGQEVVIPE